MIQSAEEDKHILSRKNGVRDYSFSIVTSFRFSCSGFGRTGSTSTFGGAKYMCTDIMHIMIPKKSCKNARGKKVVTKSLNRKRAD